jgi:hypothetical protein
MFVNGKVAVPCLTGSISARMQAFSGLKRRHALFDGVLGNW